MSIAEWASIADIVAAIAVVASLVYLGVQLRQNSRATLSSNRATIHINTQNVAHPAMMDRELAGIILRAISGNAELSPEERMAASAWFFQLLKTGELAHQSYLAGELDKDYWEASMNFFRSYYQAPGFKTYWNDRRNAFTPSFQNMVDAWINDSSTPITRPDKFFGTMHKLDSQNTDTSSKTS
jgi:hypothetical protein